ncbi:MAG: DUF5596 domain-containing protein [Clostridia bacterium]|nr:DUF5596 domain-containing protein [Clostridia bacterium]
MITSLAYELGFPETAVFSLKKDFDAMWAGKEQLDAALKNLYTDEGAYYRNTVKGLAEEYGVHIYAAEMAFFLYAALPLREVYKENGYSDELYLDTMADLRYKVKECHDIYGIWGTVAGSWFRDFYLLKRFKLGRLQYEPRPLRFAEYKGYKQGDIFYGCHIPSCGPMTPEAVLDSLKRAHTFYRAKLKDGILPVHLRSFLIYPGHYEVYPEDSNLKKFYEMFDVVGGDEKPDNPYIWRIFGCENCEDYTALPERTSLQRRFKEYLLSGKCMGSGDGFLLFDGEKIIR